ncbi:MAG: hypothetical protein ACKPEN_11235 [Planktothrix sp.]|uniref:hypothetical protein n=1 Tax=Planktothrix sp. TaxID=3088171 RepID=UPI0038D41366
MSLFTAPFQPALNANGEAKLTFVGLEIKTGKTKDSGRDYQLNNLKFEVMGKIRGTSTFINISSGKVFDVQSNFCKALINMGLKPKVLMDIYNQIMGDVATTEDSDGFEVEDIPEDDDGFGVTEAPELNFDELEKFCLLNCQKVFTGKVFLNDKKYWEINAETIKPLAKPKAEKEKKSGKKSKTVTETETTEETEA